MPTVTLTVHRRLLIKKWCVLLFPPFGLVIEWKSGFRAEKMFFFTLTAYCMTPNCLPCDKVFFISTALHKKIRLASCVLDSLSLIQLQRLRLYQHKRNGTPSPPLRRLSHMMNNKSRLTVQAGSYRQSVKWRGAEEETDESQERFEIGGMREEERGGRHLWSCVEWTLLSYSCHLKVKHQKTVENMAHLLSFFFRLCFLWEREYVNLRPIDRWDDYVVL